MDRYILQKSEEHEHGWVLTDTHTEIVCTFIEGKFNDTQKFTPLHDISAYNIAELPTIVKNMTQWLVKNHYEIAMGETQFIEQCRKEIGNQLRAVRERGELSIQNLAYMTNMSKNNIVRIEGGKYNYTIDSLIRVCNALDIKLELSD